MKYSIHVQTIVDPIDGKYPIKLGGEISLAPNRDFIFMSDSIEDGLAKLDMSQVRSIMIFNQSEEVKKYEEAEKAKFDKSFESYLKN